MGVQSSISLIEKILVCNFDDHDKSINLRKFAIYFDHWSELGAIDLGEASSGDLQQTDEIWFAVLPGKLISSFQLLFQ